MATDNRTTLNDCSSITGWTGDDAVTVVTDTGQFYEGGSSLSTQLTNADEHMYTTSIGGTRDLSDATVYMLIKDNLVDTKANGGVKVVIGDGTNRIGFEVGGNDDVGLPLPTFFNSYKLDVANRGAVNGHAFAGSAGSLSVSAITSTGYGSFHLSKAVGSIDNAFMDRFSFGANTAYHMTVNAGTSGTPETFADIVADDVSGGWGMISNPRAKQYLLHASTEFGDTAAADSYFVDSDFQLFLLGGDAGAGNFIFRTIANASQFHRLRWSNAVVIGIGTRAVWDLSDNNFDDLQFTNVTFTDIGAMTFPTTQDSNRFLQDCIFNNCDLLNFGGTNADGVVINGTTRADGALVLDENTTRVEAQDNFTFNSDGSGHAYEIAPTGSGPFTYNISGWKYNGYAGTPGSESGGTDAVLFINPSTLSADITINISGGGDSPSYRVVGSYTGTVTINNNVNVTLSGLKDNTEVRVYDQSNPPVELAGVENATDGTPDNRSFTFSLGAGQTVNIAVFNITWNLPPNHRIENFLIPSTDTTIPLTQVIERNYSNP